MTLGTAALSITNPSNPASPLYGTGINTANQTSQNATQAAQTASEADPIIGTALAMMIALFFMILVVYS